MSPLVTVQWQAKTFRLLALFCLMATAALARADPYFASSVVFERADFVENAERLPPGDDAPWKSVALPHEWRHGGPQANSTGWYRMKFPLNSLPAGVHGIFIPHRRSMNNEFYINGALFGVSASAIAYNDLGIPINLMMSAALLKPGENVLHARVEGLSTQIHGLPRVTFGGATEIMARYIRNAEISINATRAFTVIALVVGLISLVIWLARPGDRAMLWYAIAGLSWALARMAETSLQWSGADGPRFALNFFVSYGMATTVVILCLRSMEMRWPRFEVFLWVLLLTGIASAFEGYLLTNAAVVMAWDLVYTVVPLAGLASFAGKMRPRLRWSDVLQIASLLLIASLNFHEAARYFGWIDVDSIYIRLYHVPVMLFATGAAIFERHVSAMRSQKAMNAELEDRVRQKAAEIEAYHVQIEQAAREQALARERQRILEDMHDGLGASLISLLHHVRSPHADARSLEQHVQDALQEMRVAVDALQPRDGDLGAVLGSLRYRLEKTIESTGIDFIWEVDELPKIDALEPWAVLSIQRIALEAISNAVRHSGAIQLRFVARGSAQGVEILIEDNGKGFEAAKHLLGHGLRIMRARAERLGGRLEINSHPGRGTCVRLVLRLSLPRADTIANPERDGTLRAEPSPA